MGFAWALPGLRVSAILVLLLALPGLRVSAIVLLAALPGLYSGFTWVTG